MKSNILQSVDLTTLTQSERCIYAYLKEHPRAILTSNLEGLCREMYISTASMVRFCQKLGFSGYNEFKFSLRQELEDIREDIKEIQYLLNWQLSVAMDSLSQIDLPLLRSICDELCRAKVCYVYGTDSSLMAAQYFHSIMTALDYRTILLQGRYLLEAFTYNFDETEDAVILLFTAHASQEYYSKILNNLKSSSRRVIWICSEENHSIPLSQEVFIHTQETNIIYRNIDFNFKLSTFTLIQVLIELIYQRVFPQLPPTSPDQNTSQNQNIQKRM